MGIFGFGRGRGEDMMDRLRQADTEPKPSVLELMKQWKEIAPVQSGYSATSSQQAERLGSLIEEIVKIMGAVPTEQFRQGLYEKAGFDESDVALFERYYYNHEKTKTASNPQEEQGEGQERLAA